MRLNRKCPCYNICKAENERMEKLWRFVCPEGKYRDCMKYDEIQRSGGIDAIPNNRQTTGERKK